jgi:hypothetical protein
VLKFFEKCEDRYKLIFVKKEYLIDIRKDKGSYCGVYLSIKENQRETAVNALNHVQLDLRALLCIIIVIFLDW